MMGEYIKEGFSLVNRNWQLVPIRAVVDMISVFFVFLFIGIPVVIAVISLGIDITQAGDIFPDLFSDPSRIISRYLGIIFLFLFALLLSITVVSLLSLYFYGGSMGVLKNSAFQAQYRFSLRSFFQEAGGLFYPLFWLISFILLVTIGVVIVFGMVTGIVVFMLRMYGGMQSAFSVFVISFFSLSLVFLSVMVTLGGLIFTVYSVITLVVEGKGTMDSLRGSWEFLKKQPKGFLFYVVLLLGFISINVLLMILGGLLKMIPVIGDVLTLPYPLILYALQVYLNLVLWSSLLVYYIRRPAGSISVTYDI